MTTVHTQLKRAATPWRQSRPAATPARQQTKCLDGFSHYWGIDADPSQVDGKWVFLAVCKNCGERTEFPYKYTPGNGPAEESAVKRLREPTYEELVRAVIRGAETL